MDREWAIDRLTEFRENIDALRDLTDTSELEGEVIDNILMTYGTSSEVVDRLVTLDPVMRELMEAAQTGLGEYSDVTSGGYSIDNPDYWHDVVRPRVLRAIGIHSLGAEARKRMQPDSPDLAADQLHPWVWEAAAPLWNAGSRPDAIHAAARSVNAHLQQMRGHHDKSEAALCREFFSPDPPAPGRPRLRFPGTTTSATWRSRQQGAMEFGAGCFTGIRNPVAHEDGLKLTEQVALEYLAAFSVLARWIDECTVEAVS